MTLHVVDAYEGDVQAPGQRFGERQPHHQRSCEPRAPGGGDRVELVRVDTCLRERHVDEGPYRLDVGPGGDLRDDAPKALVRLGLAAQDRRPHFQPFDDRHPGLVTARLDAEDQRPGRRGHVSASSSVRRMAPRRSW